LDYNWLSPKAQMRITLGKGSGSFAIAPIFKDEVVASFGGFVVNKQNLTNYTKDRVARSLQLNVDKNLSPPFPKQLCLTLFPKTLHYRKIAFLQLSNFLKLAELFCQENQIDLWVQVSTKCWLFLPS